MAFLVYPSAPIFSANAGDTGAPPTMILTLSRRPVKTETTNSGFPWRVVLIPLGVVALAGAGIGAGIVLHRRRERDDVEDDTQDAEYEEAEDDEEEEDDT